MNQITNGHDHTDEIRNATAKLYGVVGEIRSTFNLPILLDQVRADLAALKLEAEASKKENEALRAALTILRMPVEASAPKTREMPKPEAFKPAAEIKLPEPTSELVVAPKARNGKGGRPTNHALVSFLKAGYFEKIPNDKIANLFGVSVNTIRRHMWELHLKRDTPMPRKRRKSRKAK